MNRLLSGDSMCLHLFPVHEHSLANLGSGKGRASLADGAAVLWRGCSAQGGGLSRGRTGWESAFIKAKSPLSSFTPVHLPGRKKDQIHRFANHDQLSSSFVSQAAEKKRIPGMSFCRVSKLSCTLEPCRKLSKVLTLNLQPTATESDCLRAGGRQWYFCLDPK